MTERPADWAQRRKATDISRSCIVQAPAGSGKTELLTQRLLALLAVAEKPEEILAITFTRKAAGEMKERLLAALKAAEQPPPEAAHARETWELACRVLDADRQKGWFLQENPARLQLLTIDSLCAHLTRRMPWLARFGDQPAVSEQPTELYRLAAERLLGQTDDSSAAGSLLGRLLGHLDNRMTLLRDLLMSMLARRDQWLRHILQHRQSDARHLLEQGLQTYIESVLEQGCAVLSTETQQELLTLGRYAAENLAVTDDASPLTPLLQSGTLAATSNDLPAWLAIAHLTLTGKGDLRKSVNKRSGFPAARDGDAYEMKQRMKSCLEALKQDDLAQAYLRSLRQLPAASYTDAQWVVLDALIELLPLAVVELTSVFRSQGAVDFLEIAGAAFAALGDLERPEDLLLQLDSTLRHILMDEFQDTSHTQLALLQKLTAGWQSGDGRSLFIVGDPMQSIYRFREAEVGLFLRVCEQGLNGLQLERLFLSANFRSQEKLVNWFNDFFRPLFPAQEDQLRGAVRFFPAEAVHPPLDGATVSFSWFEGRQDRAEAERVLEIIQQEQRHKPSGNIAVLVRSRHHLKAVVQVFKEAGVSFQAQDIDSLAERPVVQDLLALTRALFFPIDRVAWLAILRAPWCGLSLADLHAISGQQSPEVGVQELLAGHGAQIEMFDILSPEGEQRVSRVMAVLEKALQLRGRLPLRQLVESTWLSLGGPACVSAAALLDADQVFQLLETLDEGGDLASLPEFEEGLDRLFAAADSLGDVGLQVMTIHKAKGLEFDTVIVPGMGRSVRGGERSLLRWLEYPGFDLLLAPIPASYGTDEDPTYQAIGQVLKERDDLETIRLLYVAATRARQRLYLLGHVERTKEGTLRADPGSFFGRSWTSCAPWVSDISCVDANDSSTLPPLAQLSRLPLDWALPLLEPPVKATIDHSKRASDAGHYRSAELRSLRTEEGRVVGTLIHAWLQRIAEEGVDSWDRPRLLAEDKRLRAHLFRGGLAASQHDRCLMMILQCLENTLTCSRGRWLLSPHPEAACELELNGVVNGDIVRASIDRTFLDKGVRWVVDYKTSQPAADASIEDFLAVETDRYAGQLVNYRHLLQDFDADHPVRAALYFPAISTWYEFEA